MARYVLHRSRYCRNASITPTVKPSYHTLLFTRVPSRPGVSAHM